MDDYSELVQEYLYLCNELNCDCPYNTDFECDCEPLSFGYTELEERLHRMKAHIANQPSRLTKIERMMEEDF